MKEGLGKWTRCLRPLPSPKQELQPLPRNLCGSASPTAVSAVRLSRLLLAHVPPTVHGWKGTHTACGTPGFRRRPALRAPRTPGLRAAGAASPSRPASGTVTAAAASSLLMPQGSSGPAAGWPSPAAANARRLRLPWWRDPPRAEQIYAGVSCIPRAQEDRRWSRGAVITNPPKQRNFC